MLRSPACEVDPYIGIMERAKCTMETANSAEASLRKICGTEIHLSYAVERVKFSGIAFSQSVARIHAHAPQSPPSHNEIHFTW